MGTLWKLIPMEKLREVIDQLPATSWSWVCGLLILKLRATSGRQDLCRLMYFVHMDQTKTPDPETLKNYKALICHVFYRLLSSATPQFFRTWHPLWGLWQIILSPSRTSSFFPVHALKTQLTINIPAVQGNASEAFRRKKKKKASKVNHFP